MISSLTRAVALLSFSLATAMASAQPEAQGQRRPMIISPTVDGMLLCDEAAKNTAITNIDAAYAYCGQRKLDGAAAITRLLNTLEPGGAKGAVQVGYTATLQLLGLFQKTSKGWAIDKERVDTFLRVISKVDRPVILYFSADHFDSIGPLAEELRGDPVNLMQLRDGKPLELGYFGYRIIPYTLSPDPTIPVNRYRFEALDYLAQRIKALPQKVQRRIVAYTLAGELHHMFPDFENGMGAYQDIQVTDYSPSSVAAFRQWLRVRYQTVDQFNTAHGFAFASFDAIPAPSRDIRKEKLSSFAEHYDAFATGTLPIAGWLWDPGNRIQSLDLYVDGQLVGAIPRGLNRLDVYRAENTITDPNTGYRYDLDFSSLTPGRHLAQVVAVSQGVRHQVAQVEFVIVPRDQGRVRSTKPAQLSGLKDAKQLPGVRSWLDMPRPLQDLYYNPIARDWNKYRESQVYGFLQAFHDRALKAGLPKSQLFSHQIVPDVNSSWNPILFAAGTTLEGSAPWQHGLNMYGGATNSTWLRSFMERHKITDYGAPEFNPQQWKRDGVHLAALQSHLDAGARFISPYYFSVIPDRFKGDVEHGVNRMEIRPDNTKDGSDKFFHAIIEFAKR